MTTLTRPDSQPQQDSATAPPWRLLWVESEAEADRLRLGMTAAELVRTVFVWEVRA